MVRSLAIPLYGGIVALVLLAAFTKSAQFPFHFWLPNAMQAPTPVSAYLHSATMVKAGVYLVARMTPMLGGTDAVDGHDRGRRRRSRCVGALRALLETDLKRVLAYSTISALGVLMLLFGIGTPQAVTAGLVYLVAHACYKGALFLVAGAVEHETGTRDVAVLGGLRRAMPATALRRGAGRRFDGGRAAVRRLHRQGAVLRQRHPGGASRRLGARVLVVAGRGGQHVPGRGRADCRHRALSRRCRADTRRPRAPPALWLGPLVLGALGVILGVVPALACRPDRPRQRGRHRDPIDRRPQPSGTASPDAGAERADPGWIGRPVRLARSSVAAAVAAPALRTEHLVYAHAGGPRRAQPPRRSGAAERVAALVRAHRHRHGGRARDDRACDRARLADAAPLRRRSSSTKRRWPR